MKRPTLLTHTSKTLGLVLMMALGASAGIEIEFDKDRIEAGKPFELRMVLPVNELPADRSLPTLADIKGFTFQSIDSLDEVAMDFFAGRQMLRKYIFRMVAPKESGKYQIGPLEWKVAGKTHRLGMVNVTVARPYDAPSLTVRLSAGKRKVYVGEQLPLQITLEAYENFQGNLNMASADLGNDFYAHRSDLKDLKFERTPKGPAALAASTRFAWVSPLREGSLEIPALKFTYMRMGAPKIEEKRVGGFYSRSVSQQPEEASAVSSPLRIDVRPLPPGAPQNFSGLVGQYTFEATVDRTALQVGEALTLTVRIRGNGKPGSLPEPQFPVYADFRSVPPESKVEKSINDGQVITERISKVFLYPRKKGTFTLLPIGFSWFDPVKARYETAQSETWTIEVSKGEITEAAATGGGGMVVETGPNKTEIQSLGQDIRHMREDSPMIVQTQKAYANPWNLLWLILPFLLAPVSFRLHQVRTRSLGDAALQRRAQAKRRLKERLNIAAHSNESIKQWNAVLENALLDWMSDLANKEFRGMTRDVLEKSMLESGWNRDQVIAVQAMLQQFEFARFAPVDEASDIAVQIEATRKLCTQLEAKA